jgi:linoleoyl-CoA desaturase
MHKRISFIENDQQEREFSRLLNARIRAYFRKNGISRYANREMHLKTALALSSWLASYAFLFFLPADPAVFIPGYVFHGLTHAFIAFNIGHDANHGAYSSNPKVNALLSLSFDLVGVSSYMWRLLHNASHHNHVNLYGIDEAIDSNGAFRFSPEEPWKPIHRFQHIYAPFLYSLITLQWVFVKDFRWLFKKEIGPLKKVRHPAREYAILFGGKIFYYSYTLVIPIIFLSAPWYFIVAGFLFFHLIIGFTIAVIFQTTHLVEGTVFPQTGSNGIAPHGRLRHLLATTADYGWRNRWFNWMVGCLNVHCIHHMMPNICHVHYEKLTHILQETAEEAGLSYRDHSSLWSAFLSHWRLLRELGRNDIPNLSKASTMESRP